MQCGTCHSMFDTSVLRRPTVDKFSEYLVQATRAIVATAVAMPIDGASARISAALSCAHARGDLTYSASLLQRDAERAVEGFTYMESHLRSIASELSPAGAEQMMMAFIEVCAADGQIIEVERNVAVRIGVLLELTPAHINGVLALAGVPQFEP